MDTKRVRIVNELGDRIEDCASQVCNAAAIVGLNPESKVNVAHLNLVKDTWAVQVHEVGPHL